MDPNPNDHETLYRLGLALLELLDRPIALELEQGDRLAGLALNGTLLRAFDPPNTTSPTITLMVGAHAINLRLTNINRVHYDRSPIYPRALLGVHLLLADGYALHIRPQQPPP